MAMKGTIHYQTSRIGASPSDVLVSKSGHSLWEDFPFVENAVGVLQGSSSRIKKDKEENKKTKNGKAKSWQEENLKKGKIKVKKKKKQGRQKKEKIGFKKGVNKKRK